MPNLKKTALCENFKKGKCLLPSDECSYAHGEHELRKGAAFQSIRKNSEELSPRSDGSSGKPVQPTPQGGQLPEFPAADERDPEPSLHYPQRYKEQLGQGLCNSKPRQKQRRQPLQDVGAREDVKQLVFGSQGFPSTQGSELQLQELLKSIRELMVANPDLASRLAPPGLPMPSTGTTAAVTPIMMCADVFEPKSKPLGHPMRDDEPWRVPLSRCGLLSDSISPNELFWQL